MPTSDLDGLVQRIETMRQELQNLVKDNPYQLRTRRVYVLSQRLDELITQFNRLTQVKSRRTREEGDE